MTDRWCLYKTHKLSHRRNFDIDGFNSLTHEHALVSEQIDRLEDELQVLYYWGEIIVLRKYDWLRDFLTFICVSSMLESSRRLPADWLSEKFSTTSKFFLTKLISQSDRARRAESKTYIHLPSRVPLEFSRNSQSPKNGYFRLKLLSNWGSNQTMHGAAE